MAYAPECVEGEFSEVRLVRVLGSMFTCSALRIVPTVTTYYVFGSYCNGIGISKRSEVRLCIRGSATVPTISFILSRAPRRCPPVYTDTKAALFTQVPRKKGAFSEVRGSKQPIRHSGEHSTKAWRRPF